MIQELINKISEAEKNADEMTAAALEEAKAMNLNAEAEAVSIIAAAKAKAKEERKKVAEYAEKLAEERYAEIIGIGEREAEKLAGSIEVKKEAQSIVDAYCRLYER